jgi:hypothetical protein
MGFLGHTVWCVRQVWMINDRADRTDVNNILRKEAEKRMEG